MLRVWSTGGFFFKEQYFSSQGILVPFNERNYGGKSLGQNQLITALQFNWWAAGVVPFVAVSANQLEPLMKQADNKPQTQDSAAESKRRLVISLATESRSRHPVVDVCILCRAADLRL